ncbi:MAG: hypothetical protein FD134_1575 [Gallionellaceae bacterium]|nr:MAG: hypothetical protein FD134_1575 [Gallionellaceae bacterium]
MNTANEDHIEVVATSPCTDNCCLDEQGVCLGCYRSLDEINRWFQSSNQERLVFLKNAYLRQKAKQAP